MNYTDKQKELLILHSIIPLVSATYSFFSSLIPSCYNKSISNEEVFTPDILTSYCQYLLPLATKSSTTPTYLLIAILQLNTVVLQHLFPILSEENVRILYELGDALLDTKDSTLSAYVVQFLCQYVNFVKQNELVMRLFVIIIHMYNNPKEAVVSRASYLLEKRMFSSHLFVF